MRIIVTGGAGFIGSHLTDALIQRGHTVAVLDNLSTGRKEFLNPKAKFYECDIRDKNAAAAIEKEQPDTIFHLAAQINVRTSTEDPVFDNAVNVGGTLNIIVSFLKTKAANKQFIFSSTGGAIYGETDLMPTPETIEPFPLCPYGIAKYSVEKYLHYFGVFSKLRYTALRYGNVYGPRQNAFSEAGVVAIFSVRMLKGETCFINGDGGQTRDFVFVEDVVRANLLALEKNVDGYFNVGTSQETSVNQIYDYLNEAMGGRSKKEYNPPKEGEVRRSCLSFEKINKAFGWRPEVSIRDGIKKTADWFRGQ